MGNLWDPEKWLRPTAAADGDGSLGLFQVRREEVEEEAFATSVPQCQKNEGDWEPADGLIMPMSNWNWPRIGSIDDAAKMDLT